MSNNNKRRTEPQQYKYLAYEGKFPMAEKVTAEETAVTFVEVVPADEKVVVPARTFTDAQIQHAARVAHEVNRTYCIGIGGGSQHVWEGAADWQRTSVVNGVKGVIAGNGPGASHESWLAEKVTAGWKHGLVKSEAKKEHPCMVPFAQLPLAQQAKDYLFVHTVKGVLGL